MKLQLQFKTPDAVDLAKEEINDEEVLDRFNEIVDKYIQYGEYITVEIDTDTGQITVIPT